MDTPGSCRGCNFFVCDGDTNMDSCMARETARSVDLEKYDKTDWCPLKPMPEKKPETILKQCEGSRFGAWEVTDLKSKGWNACIDSMLGNPDCEGCICPTCKDGCENAGYEPNTCQSCEGQAIKACIKHK